MECEIATVNSNMEQVKEILEEVKTIAVIGLSPDETKASNQVAKYLQSVGYKIYPVYPKEEKILGEKVYRALTDIPDKIDMVNIFRKPAVVMAVVDKAIVRGDIDIIWAQIGIVNNKAGEKAIENGMKFVQNRCSMVDHKELFC